MLPSSYYFVFYRVQKYNFIFKKGNAIGLKKRENTIRQNFDIQ